MQPDTLAVVATVTSGPTFLDQIAATLAAITPIMTLLVGWGLIHKYAPFMEKIPNLLIPFFNAIIAFLGVFAGAAPPIAQAGVFGDFVHSLSFPAKAAGSLLLSGIASNIYEIFIRPALEKAGKFGAGLSKAQIAAKKQSVV